MSSEIESLTNHTCPNINTYNVEQETFFTGPFDDHKLGWIIAGVCAIVTTILTFISVIMHGRNYWVPREQKQVLRIILMPMVYAIISFFSYRYFRAYTYFSLAVVVYESLVIAAFLMLLLQYIGESDLEQRSILMQKSTQRIPIPFCCIKYQPHKPYFLVALKWSVLQYSLLRPLISIAGIVTDALGVYCPTSYSVYFAAVYLDSIDFVSISVALYGLIVFYALVRDRLRGKQPLAKFLSIKGIVIVTFYQSFVFNVLQSHGVIKGTTYWTSVNVANGLQALCTCVEMVIFAAVFIWSFSWKPYAILKPKGEESTNIFWAVVDSLNYSDFIMEGWRGIVFLGRFILGRPGTRASNQGPLNINQAFEGEDEYYNNQNSNPRSRSRNSRRNNKEMVQTSNNPATTTTNSNSNSNSNSNTIVNGSQYDTSNHSSPRKGHGNVGSIDGLESLGGRNSNGGYSSAEIYRNQPLPVTLNTSNRLLASEEEDSRAQNDSSNYQYRSRGGEDGHSEGYR